MRHYRTSSSLLPKSNRKWLVLLGFSIYGGESVNKFNEVTN